VRWTPSSDGDERKARDASAAGYPVRGVSAGAAGGPVAAWEGHLEVLGRWARCDWPLSPDGRAVAEALAHGLGLRLGAQGSGNGRGALGEVVRLVLAAAQADVATLRAALADHRAPATRALLAGVLGAPWLLAVVRLRGTAVAGTELRACASREEAAAVLTALTGGDATGAHGPLPALRALVTGGARGPRRDAPLLGDGGRDAAPNGADDVQLLVLPLLTLEGAIPTEPPAAVLAGVLGAALPRAGSPFLDETPAARVEAPAEEDEEAAEDDEADDDARDAEARDEEDDEEAADDDAAPTRAAPRAFGAPAPAPPAEPEPVEPEAMAAALARLRARRRAPERVAATVASDDGVVEHVTDVTPWLAEASAAEVRALAGDGWTGEEATEVARALAGDDPEVAEVVRHARRSESELLVEIDGRAASAWLRANRPDLADTLDDLLD
jgi:hypothetical protein